MNDPLSEILIRIADALEQIAENTKVQEPENHKPEVKGFKAGEKS